MITLVSGGGGHARLTLGIAEVLEGLNIKFNIFHTGSKIESEWFKKYENYAILRPTIPMEKFSPIRFIKAYIRVIQKSRKIKKIVISSGASLSFVISTYSKILGKKIINIEVPDRIINHSDTFSKLSNISYLDIVSWKEQRLKDKTEILGGVILPKPLAKVKRGEYILISTGTTHANHRTIQKIVDVVNKIGEKVVVIYHGNNKIRGAKVIREFIPQIKLERIISKAKLVISHPGYTAFESAINYGKSVHLIVIKEYKKGPQIEDVRVLAKKLNLSFGEITEEKIIQAMKKKPKKMNANKKLSRIVSKLVTE